MSAPAVAQVIAWRVEAAFYDLFAGMMRILPIDVASDLGGCLGRVLGPRSSINKTVSRNLDIAFPDMPAEEKQALILRQWENTGRTFAEFPIIDRILKSPGRMRIEGRERLEDVANSGRPVVVVAAHQSNWELVPCAVLEAGIPFLVTYRAANNPFVDERIKAGRKRYGVTLFGPKGSDGARELLTALGQGTSVGLMNDQKFNRGVPVEFFGQIADTAPGPSRLAQRFGADLLPMTVRREHKARFVVEVHAPFRVPDSGDKSSDIASSVQRITKVIEGVVRGNPSEWFWTHKRWPNESYKSTV